MFNRSNSIITSHNRVNAILQCFINNSYINSISITYSVWHTVINNTSTCSDCLYKNCCRTYPINVIIAHYPNFNTLINFFIDNFNCLYQILHLCWIVEGLIRSRKIGIQLFICTYISIPCYSGNHLVYTIYSANLSKICFFAIHSPIAHISLQTLQIFLCKIHTLFLQIFLCKITYFILSIYSLSNNNKHAL